jgi:hypothetical protein
MVVAFSLSIIENSSVMRAEASEAASKVDECFILQLILLYECIALLYAPPRHSDSERRHRASLHRNNVAAVVPEPMQKEGKFHVFYNSPSPSTLLSIL